MFKKWIIPFLALASNLFSHEVPLQKREVSREMTTSIIIPCASLHFEHIFNLLQHFEHQTVLPDEVVISVGKFGSVDMHEVNKVENYPWPFSLILLKHMDQKSAGMNRNLAAQNAHGDILICQDADDIPHPQRVEIVKHLFETYEIGILLHCYHLPGSSFAPYVKENILVKQFSNLRSLARYASELNTEETNGNPCVLREVALNFLWPDRTGARGAPIGEDVEFNHNVASHYGKIAFTNAKLHYYRISLGTSRIQNWPWMSSQ